MNDPVDIMILLDRSGSMVAHRDDHQGGLRSFVRDQRALPGDARFTFIRFDTVEPFEIVYDRVPLAEVEEDRLTLTPRAGTPLLEAVSRALDHLGAKLTLAGTPPHPVIAMIVTDGQENSSGASYTKAKVQAQVRAAEAAGWTILYLGSNVDEFAEAQGLGVDPQHTLGYVGAATPMAYAAMSENIISTRRVYAETGSLAQASAHLAVTEKQRTDSKSPPPEASSNTTITTGGT